MPFLRFFQISLSTLVVFTCFSCLNAQQKVFYNDSFNNNHFKWDIYKSRSSAVAIRNNHLFFANYVNKDREYLFNYFYFDPNYNYEIETKIVQVSGNELYSYGLVFGARDIGNHYQFKISSKGYYKIIKVQNGISETLVSATKSSFVNTTGKENILKVYKSKSLMYFYINGNEVYRVFTQSLMGNHIGYFVEDKMIIKVDYLKLSGKVKKCSSIKNISKVHEPQYLSENINSPYVELYPVISGNGRILYFLRKGDPKNMGMKGFDDIWISHYKNNVGWTKAVNPKSPLNNERHNFVISTSTDGNSVLLGGSYGSQKGGVYESHKIESGWSIPQPLAIKDYYNLSTKSSFCLSADQRFLIMGVERKNGKGARDLYVSFKQNDNTWSKPLNLGEDINTFGREITPFLAADNKTLYFSSNGYNGKGDNDIYVTRRLDDTWQKWSRPKNLGAQINNDKWDAYFSVTANGNYAYFVSDSSKYGFHDIKRIQLVEELQPDAILLLSGKTFEQSDSSIIGAKIKIYDMVSGEFVGFGQSNPITGDYEIALPLGRKIGIYAEKEGYFAEIEMIDLRKSTSYTEVHQDLYLGKLQEGSLFQLNQIYFDRNKATLKKNSYYELNKLIEVLNKHQNLQISIEGHTEPGNNDRLVELSEQRVKAVIEYLISKGIMPSRLKGIGHGGKKPLNNSTLERELRRNRRVEFKIIKN